MKKKILISLITLSLNLPLYTYAADLTIINNTSRYSTSVINNGPCSDILGPNGITHPHSTNTVPDNIINKGCITNRINCKADVHMTSNCSGPTIATVVFDVKKGIKSIQPVDTSEGYVVSGSGFTASFSGGPAAKNWLQRIFG